MQSLLVLPSTSSCVGAIDVHVLIYSRYYTAKHYNIYAHMKDGCSGLHLAADDVMSKLAFIYFLKLNSWGSNPRPSEYLPLATQHTSYII